MSYVAAWIARRLWWASLWLMRRTWMRRLQRGAERFIPERRRPKSRAALRRQNRLARRIGLPMLTFVMNLLLASILLQTLFMLSLRLAESGALTIPDEYRERSNP